MVPLNRDSVLLSALYPSSGAPPAVLPHPHGSHEAPTIPSASPEEIFLWGLIPARAPRRAASAEAHQEESQGTVIPVCP